MADFSFTPNGNLKITLGRGDKTRIKELRKKEGLDDDRFLELIDRQLCNGWDNVSELACWGGRINLTQDLETDEHGNITHLGAIYTYENYQICSEIDALLEDGYVILTKFE